MTLLICLSSHSLPLTVALSLWQSLSSLLSFSHTYCIVSFQTLSFSSSSAYLSHTLSLHPSRCSLLSVWTLPALENFSWRVRGIKSSNSGATMKVTSSFFLFFSIYFFPSFLRFFFLLSFLSSFIYTGIFLCRIVALRCFPYDIFASPYVFHFLLI